ncbi:hypothetical protein Droror1_Dr00018006 [Drosera rotundifolia]
MILSICKRGFIPNWSLLSNPDNTHWTLLQIVRCNSPFSLTKFFSSNSSSPSSSATTVATQDELQLQQSFVVSYLINSCGLSPKSAASVYRTYAHKLRFDSTEKPDSMLAFLRKHGFTDADITRMGTWPFRGALPLVGLKNVAEFVCTQKSELKPMNVSMRTRIQDSMRGDEFEVFDYGSSLRRMHFPDICIALRCSYCSRVLQFHTTPNFNTQVSSLSTRGPKCSIAEVRMLLLKLSWRAHLKLCWVLFV